MRLEKVNDNQIRCILTKEDLEERKIKFSELTFGGEKAKRLFRDVMQQKNRCSAGMSVPAQGLFLADIQY